MGLGGCLRRAIANAARLQHIAERQIVRDALGVDPQRTRSDQLDVAAAEPGAAAAIFDHRLARAVAADPTCATAPAMLVMGEHREVAEALARRGLRPGHARDLPQPRARLNERTG